VGRDRVTRCAHRRPGAGCPDPPGPLNGNTACRTDAGQPVRPRQRLRFYRGCKRSCLHSATLQSRSYKKTISYDYRAPSRAISTVPTDGSGVGSLSSSRRTITRSIDRWDADQGAFRRNAERHAVKCPQRSRPQRTRNCPGQLGGLDRPIRRPIIARYRSVVAAQIVRRRFHEETTDQLQPHIAKQLRPDDSCRPWVISQGGAASTAAGFIGRGAQEQ